MHCVRCQGLMVGTHFFDFEGGFGEMWRTSWQCVNCGHMHDAGAERNRLARQENMLVCATPAEQDADTYLGGEAFVRPAA